mmetsp:Transcript_18718/g.60118  ORF Transcript_18718/g.60118 Transcript_18718/m.60118 type:complete len:202 (+) Transcript_18718:561-1166(+)
MARVLPRRPCGQAAGAQVSEVPALARPRPALPSASPGARWEAVGLCGAQAPRTGQLAILLTGRRPRRLPGPAAHPPLQVPILVPARQVTKVPRARRRAQPDGRAALFGLDQDPGLLRGSAPGVCVCFGVAVAGGRGARGVPGAPAACYGRPRAATPRQVAPEPAVSRRAVRNRAAEAAVPWGDEQQDRCRRPRVCWGAGDL